MIDPGHGGKDSGAVGYKKYREKHTVLKVAKLIAKLLKKSNITFLNFPMIETLPSELNEEITKAFDELESIDWLVFTSRNGVKAFLKLWNEYNKKDFKKFANTKIATIGRSTASLLNENGIKVDFINPGSTSGEFVHHIDKDEIIQNTHKVLLVLGNLAPDILYSKIKDITPTVKRINVYYTRYKKETSTDIYDIIEKNKYSLVSFTSPSAFDNFYRNMKDACKKNLRIATLGKTTASFVKHKGCQVEFTPSKAEFDLFAREVVTYIKNNKF